MAVAQKRQAPQKSNKPGSTAPPKRPSTAPARSSAAAPPSGGGGGGHQRAGGGGSGRHTSDFGAGPSQAADAATSSGGARHSNPEGV